MTTPELVILLIAIAVIFIAAVATAISRSKRRSAYKGTSYIFNEDGTVKWPEFTGQSEGEPDPAPWPMNEWRPTRLRVHDENGPVLQHNNGGGWKNTPQEPLNYTSFSIRESDRDGKFKIHKLECDNCGGDLTVMNGKRLAFCAFCNAQYYLENFEPNTEEFERPRRRTPMSQPYCLEEPLRYVDGGASYRNLTGFVEWLE